jgi:AraC family transcriptional regulator, positive regulator of tynA and feaB
MQQWTEPLPVTRLSSDEWISSVHLACANDPVDVEPKVFAGWLRTFSLFGLEAFDAACNIPKIERTQRHTRLDGLEDYSAIFQITGGSAIDHKDKLFELVVGDVVLVDPTRPMTVFRTTPGVVRHVALHLPRQQLVSHLGFEPKGGIQRRGTLANRLLFQLISEALQYNGSAAPLPEASMRFVVYDLLAALFASDGQNPVSPHTDKLFAHICSIIRERLADPDLSPSMIAAETGISARYLQKLFSMRGTTCSHFIYSLRLDHASRLLQRRASRKLRQPLAEVATACGFLDYAHFSRKFRERFGHPPSAHAEERSAQPDK